MGFNATAAKRGWHWDEANSKLSVYVDGVEAGYFTTAGAYITVAGTGEVTFGSDATYPTTTDSNALGNITNMWSDLFLASGGVINFNNGEITITHSETGKLVVASTWSTASATGRPFGVNLTVNATLGGWANALKGYAEYGTSGKVTGLASAINAELKLPNISMGMGGQYFPLEIEYVAAGSSVVTQGALTGNCVGFIYMGNSGDADGDFDDNGYFMRVVGLTAGAGHLLSADSATLRVGIGTTNRYLVMSTAENALTTSSTITSSNTTAGFVASGAATDGISITGACTDGLSISGACTYAVHMTGTINSGCGIYAVHSQTSACYSGIWYEIASTVTNDDFSVIRGIGTSNSASTGNQIRVIRGQAKCGASKHADLLEGGSFEVDYSAGSCDVLRVCAIAGHISQGAGLANCGNLYVAHLRAQTRGDESITTDDDILYLENEAVGGNGRQMDAYIKCGVTSMGGGTKGAGYLIDGGTGTGLLATAMFRIPDDGTVGSSSGMSASSTLDNFNDFDGYITITIGSQVTHLLTLNTIPS